VLHRRCVRGHAFSELCVHDKRLTHEPVPRAPNVPRECAQLQAPVIERPDRVFGEHSEHSAWVRCNIHVAEVVIDTGFDLGGLDVVTTAFVAEAEEPRGDSQRAGDERHHAGLERDCASSE
jgi:hypothetical protein